MDLKDGWEKKALIGLGVVVVLIIIYAYFVPFSGTPNTNISTNQPVPAQVVPIPYTQPAVNNSSSNNNSTNSVNLTADQAKNIALNANPGSTADTPTFQNNIPINGTKYSAWVVAITLPKSEGGTTKNVYVDNSGRIIPS